ncbi:MAG: prepilin-type N-terminal cleavage/methylation domain-containing protein [Candidatus Electrothrix sp. AX5]|nr:prepilin-type N-terminal cleavage/methylation domain-containing protein [Candidatus Electrothrix sp. AX5]
MLLKDSLSGCLFGKQSERGLSLVELMTTLAIFGALSAIAVPGHFTTRPRRRLKAATRELYGIMQQARIMAVKEHRSKRVRFGMDFYYLDDNNNKVCDTGEKRIELIKYHDIQFGCGNATKNWRDNPVSKATLITFSPTGTASSKTAYLQNIASPSECFAVTSQTSGSLKVRWYDGERWIK